MSLRDIIKRAELASVEIAAGGDEWWASRTKEQQKDYIAKHPNSKYAKNASSKTSNVKDKATGPKLRGPKAFMKPANKTAIKKVEDKKPVSEKPVEEPIKSKSGNVKKKIINDKMSNGKAKARSKRAALSSKEKIKHAMLRIKNLKERLTVLDAEKAYRNAARAFTKRDTTKERLTERIKKIGEIKAAINTRIKNYTKRIKELQPKQA